MSHGPHWLSSKKWFILGFLALLFPLFQNMSPTDEFQDIRKIAPRKPAGEWNDPGASLFPKNLSGDSLQDVQKSLLAHNFDSYLKDLELTYLSGKSFSNGSMSLGSDPENDEAGLKWKVGLVSPTKLRFSFESHDAENPFQMICEAQSGQEGLSFKLTRPLSSQLNLGFAHETSRRESQVQLDYRW